jgi:hypothetical protein
MVEHFLSNNRQRSSRSSTRLQRLGSWIRRPAGAADQVIE